jgi:hypothetical protein
MHKNKVDRRKNASTSGRHEMWHVRHSIWNVRHEKVDVDVFFRRSIQLLLQLKKLKIPKLKVERFHHDSFPFIY